MTELKHKCAGTGCLGINTRLPVVTSSIAIATSDQNRRHVVRTWHANNAKGERERKDGIPPTKTRIVFSTIPYITSQHVKNIFFSLNFIY